MANARRALYRMAPVVLGAVGVVIVLLAAWSFVGSSGFAYDYEAYDMAARRVAAGQPLYPPGLAEAYNSGLYAGLYLYPPPLAVALLPMTALAADDAAIAWMVLRIALLAFGAAILPISALARGAIVAIAALSFPVLYDVNLGNLSVILFMLSSVIWRFRDRPAASLALAFAGLLRYPFVLVLIAWLLARRWQAVAGTVATGLALGLATLPVVGLQGWLDYVHALSALQNLSSGPHNLSFATTAGAFGLPGSEGVWVAIGIAVAFGLTAYAAVRRDPETALVVSLAGTILFFPFFHPHYLVQLLIPTAFLIGRGQWWSLGLPLLGWLPGEMMAPVALMAMALPLLPPHFLAIRHGGAVRDGDREFDAGPATH